MQIILIFRGWGVVFQTFLWILKSLARFLWKRVERERERENLEFRYKSLEYRERITNYELRITTGELSTLRIAAIKNNQSKIVNCFRIAAIKNNQSKIKNGIASIKNCQSKIENELIYTRIAVLQCCGFLYSDIRHSIFRYPIFDIRRQIFRFPMFQYSNVQVFNNSIIYNVIRKS